MKKEEAEERNIKISWWNMGSKTTDYEGPAKGYFEKRDIKVRSIKHPFDKSINGHRFKISTSNSAVTLDVFDPDYVESINKAIMLFLTLMGDKTLYHDPYGREYKINWR